MVYLRIPGMGGTSRRDSTDYDHERKAIGKRHQVRTQEIQQERTSNARLQLPELDVTPSRSIKKVPISRKPRKDVARNEEAVFKAFLALKKKNGNNPTRIQVSQLTGLSRKKVGQYFKSLNL